MSQSKNKHYAIDIKAYTCLKLNTQKSPISNPNKESTWKMLMNIHAWLNMSLLTLLQLKT